MRHLQTKAARAALERAGRAAHQAGIPALTAEVENAARVLDAPAARLIARGLAGLGLALPHSTAFALPQGAEPIGLVWALAGSSLGNRAMLHQRRKIGAAGPERFLADPAMSAFFSGLRARIERPASAELASRAVAGAQAVFSAFLAALTDQTRNTDR